MAHGPLLQPRAICKTLHLQPYVRCQVHIAIQTPPLVPLPNFPATPASSTLQSFGATVSISGSGGAGSLVSMHMCPVAVAWGLNSSFAFPAFRPEPGEVVHRSRAFFHLSTALYVKEALSPQLHPINCTVVSPVSLNPPHKL